MWARALIMEGGDIRCSMFQSRTRRDSGAAVGATAATTAATATATAAATAATAGQSEARQSRRRTAISARSSHTSLTSYTAINERPIPCMVVVRLQLTFISGQSHACAPFRRRWSRDKVSENLGKITRNYKWRRYTTQQTADAIEVIKVCQQYFCFRLSSDLI